MFTDMILYRGIGVSEEQARKNTVTVKAGRDVVEKLHLCPGISRIGKRLK